jgi:acyl-coenzyme A thioesterase PaaI-like protein
MDIASAQRALSEIFAPWVQELGLEVQRIGEGEVVMRLPFDRRLTHVAGVVCGQV